MPSATRRDDRRTTRKIIKSVYRLLQKEQVLTVRNIARALHKDWSVTKRALEVLEDLELVDVRKAGPEENRAHFYKLKTRCNKCSYPK